MSISRKQTFAVAAIVVAGALAVFAVLYETGHGDDEHKHGHGAASAPARTPAAHAEKDRVALTEEQIRQSGIATAPATAGALHPASEFPGEIRFNADRLAHVVPRLAGIVERVSVDLGQHVRKGQPLAVIASIALSDLRSELLATQKRADLANQTFERERRLWEDKISAEQEYLQARAAREEALIAVQNAQQKLAAVGAARSAPAMNQFELRAPFDGVVIEKHMTLGEAVAETDNAFTIADLDTVWAEFIVAPQDLAAVRVGEEVTISSSALQETVRGAVSYVGPLLGDQTRTATARVTLRNPGAAWRPGLFITVKVMRPAQPVAVAVPAEAVQTLGGASAVFVAGPGGFRARPVRTGRSDGVSVEILDGLAPGEDVVVRNAFLLKAELGKGEADHAH